MQNQVLNVRYTKRLNFEHRVNIIESSEGLIKEKKMGFVSVSTENIVEKLAKDVKFLQPVYESITNSLEAHAENIEIEFFTDPSIDGVIPRINGFRITDDGEGFIDKNRKAFCELWTKNKVLLGCKGSGRFTWLSVYKDINIQRVNNKK